MDASQPKEPVVPAQAGDTGTGRNPLVAQAAQVAQTNTKAEQSSEDDPIWVEKARQVIKRSSGDPFVRHDAINKLKLQYLKQRFGKTIGGDKA